MEDVTELSTDRLCEILERAVKRHDWDTADTNRRVCLCFDEVDRRCEELGTSAAYCLIVGLAIAEAQGRYGRHNIPGDMAELDTK